MSFLARSRGLLLHWSPYLIPFAYTVFVAPNYTQPTLQYHWQVNVVALVLTVAGFIGTAKHAKNDSCARCAKLHQKIPRILRMKDDHARTTLLQLAHGAWIIGVVIILLGVGYMLGAFLGASDGSFSAAIAYDRVREGQVAIVVGSWMAIILRRRHFIYSRSGCIHCWRGLERRIVRSEAKSQKQTRPPIVYRGRG